MGIAIERQRWDRTRFHPAGEGYWLRNDPIAKLYRANPSRIVVHTTNGKVGSSFESEADWLARIANDVSAHYLVGKQGQIARILYPQAYIAWAVGTTVAGWGNYETISIECHYSPGEGAWPQPMLDSLTLLVLELCTLPTLYPIGDLRLCMERHRTIATPAGRKEDPSGFSDDHFETWRELCQCRREKA